MKKEREDLKLASRVHALVRCPLADPEAYERLEHTFCCEHGRICMQALVAHTQKPIHIHRDAFFRFHIYMTAAG